MKWWLCTTIDNDAPRLQIVESDTRPDLNEGFKGSSCSFGSLEELVKAKMIQDKKCPSCGGVIAANRNYSWSEDICFHCQFWQEKVDNPIKNRVIVKLEDGSIHHYVMGNEYSKDYFRGFGGSAFYIKFKEDNKIVKSTNMWYQGEIPKRFYKSFEINAEFISRDEFIKGANSETDKAD